MRHALFGINLGIILVAFPKTLLFLLRNSGNWKETALILEALTNIDVNHNIFGKKLQYATVS